MANWTPANSGLHDEEYSQQGYESYSNEPNYNLIVQHHESSVDTTTGPPEQIYPGVVTDEETLGAVKGQVEASQGYQEPGPFMPSVGMHSTGHDHADAFSRSVQFSGGVRQGQQFTSDPAPGAAVASVDGNHSYEDIEVSAQGEGETFRDRQHSRWAGYGG